MYRKLLNKLPLLILLLITGLYSCESRKSKKDLLKESISEFRNSIEPIEVVKYYPKEYAEIVKDSILSNGFNVKIKTFTNMNKSITRTSNSNIANYKNLYRQIESDVIVFKNGKQIFNKKIDNSFLLKHLPKYTHLNDYVGNDIYIDEEASLKKNTLVLIASLYKPKDNNCISYNIIIDENGVYKLKKLEYART